MTGTGIALAIASVVIIALIFTIDLGDSYLGYAPQTIAIGLCVIAFFVLRSMGVFALLGKIVLGLVSVLWFVYVVQQAQAGVVKHFTGEELSVTTFVLWLLILAVTFFHGMFAPGPLPGPLAYLENFGFLVTALIAFLYALIFAVVLQVIEIILNRFFGQW